MSITTDVEALEALLAPESGQRELLRAPGCWDGFSAMLVEQAGFKAAFVAPACVAMGRLGRPDVGWVTAGDMVETVAMLRDRTGLPLLVDASGGFGNALNVLRTVGNLERAGASAIQIGDERFPKRSNARTGAPALIAAADMLGKLKAALDVRRDALIIARTAALPGEGVQAALDRAAAYLEAGVDLLLLDGVRGRQDIERIGRQFGAHAPLVHNQPDSRADDPDAAYLAENGYAVQLHPHLLFQGFAGSAPAWLEQFRSHGRAEAALASPAALDALIGAEALKADDARYGA